MCIHTLAFESDKPIELILTTGNESQSSLAPVNA
jgi:hypothetical protein